MKNRLIKSLIFIGLAPLLMGASPSLVNKYIYVTSDLIGPFEKRQDDVDVNFKIVFSNQDITSGIYEQLIVGTPTRPNASVARKKSHSVTNLQEYTVTFALPLSDLFDEAGITITFRIMCESGQLYSKSAELYPPSEESINPFDYVSSYYSSKNIVMKFNQNRIVSTRERIIFKNYTTYFQDDIYYRITLDQFSFGYSYIDEPFIYKSAYMSFNNKIENLPFVGGTRIPIKLEKSGTKISFSFSNTMYVEPKTLMMSILPVPTFRATNNFYLPRNKREEMNGLQLTFCINGFGYSRTNITWTMTHDPSSNKIGHCQDSEYCVVGGVR